MVQIKVVKKGRKTLAPRPSNINISPPFNGFETLFLFRQFMPHKRELKSIAFHLLYISATSNFTDCPGPELLETVQLEHPGQNCFLFVVSGDPEEEVLSVTPGASNTPTDSFHSLVTRDRNVG